MQAFEGDLEWDNPREYCEQKKTLEEGGGR